MISGRDFRNSRVAQAVRGLFHTQTPDEVIRSLNPIAWYSASVPSTVTVTGQGVSTLADLSGNGHDLLQSTDASRPPYLAYSGTKYLYLPGVAGNYASTPDSAAFPTGDIDIIVRASADDWTPGGFKTFIAKWPSAGQFSFRLMISSANVLQLRWTEDGTTQKTSSSTAAPTVSDGETIWIRCTLDVDNGAAGNDVKFYTAADSATEPTSWTQLGTTVTTAGVTSIFNGTGNGEIGTDNLGLADAFAGKIYRAIIKSGIDGTTVVDFNPSDASDAATSFASSATGETWTINSSGGLKAQIVGRASILFDGTADYLKTNAFTLNQPTIVLIAFKQVSWTGNEYITDGNGTSSMTIQQITATPSIRLLASASGAATNGNLAVGSYGVVAAVFNGASSSLQVNLTTPTTGDPGSTNAGGFTLGASAAPSAYSNIQVLECILVPSALSTTQIQIAIMALKDKLALNF